MPIKVLALIITLGMLLTVVELIRREKLTFKYAFAWLLIGVAGLFFVIFHEVLFKMSRYFGFEVPSNFIFFVLLAFFVFLSLFLTIFLCQQNNRNDMMAQKIGRLEFELQRLTKHLKNFNDDSSK